MGMGEFYAYKYSSSHLFFPKIVITILIVLGLIILFPKIIRMVKNKEPLIPKGYRFFEENYDKLKFYGTLVLFVTYILALELIGFVPASLIFMFLFNVLFCGTFKLKSLMMSAVSTIVSVISIWYVFGHLFNITLP